MVIDFCFLISGSYGGSLSLSIPEPVLSGNEVNLTCAITGFLFFSLSWYRGNTHVGGGVTVNSAFESIYEISIIQNAYRLTIKACDYARDSNTWECASLLSGSSSKYLRVIGTQ